ncbi:hypothetical protein NC653_031738 [Populus alba x Populus x berolinensis]|uniref:Uncharacterized protein n=1 Tax=Populus alba x Populus x berolinensis TaxID=444605 RepID=A0AAD6LZI2_9ROSI|nr:hypothetical protein NC653_031738 [Populus alba x Populus x berolinensis]
MIAGNEDHHVKIGGGCHGGIQQNSAGAMRALLTNRYRIQLQPTGFDDPEDTIVAISKSCFQMESF